MLFSENGKLHQKMQLCEASSKIRLREVKCKAYLFENFFVYEREGRLGVSFVTQLESQNCHDEPTS